MTSPSANFAVMKKSSSNDQGFYRSTEMSLIQLYIPTEAVFHVTAELGELGIIQFRDLNPDVSSFQRVFTEEIRKFHEMERKILFLIEEARKEDVDIPPWDNAVINQTSTHLSLKGKTLNELDNLEYQLSETESRVLELGKQQSEITAQYFSALLMQSVLKAISPYLSSNRDAKLNLAYNADSSESDGSETTRLDDKETDSMELGGAQAAQASEDACFVAGAISKRKLLAFEKVLWRALRGNVFIRSTDCHIDGRGLLTDADALEPKSAFVAYVHGRETLSRLRKICIALGCTLFDIDPFPLKRSQQEQELALKLNDIYAVLFNSRQTKKAALSNVSLSLEKHLILVRKKKALYHVMNFFTCDSDVSARKYYLAEGWCPSSSLQEIDLSIKTASERAGINVSPVLTVLDKSGREPPTYFPTNRFTQTFQDMTDSYAVAKYGEANPSIFMIITFPFLFAVMFGDVGHGMVMTAVAAYMVLAERRLLARKLDEMVKMIFDGRYIILLMGIFSIYTGFIYNDFVSRAMFIFPTSWRFNAVGASFRPNPDYVYPFGIDPSWSLSNNALSFLNSYKMKSAILFGIFQMFLGLFINAHNFMHFNNWLDIYCIFLPQVLFMGSIFGYLSFMIFYKWVSGWDASILNMLIAMILRFGAVEGDPIYTGQRIVQTALIMVALLCIPWMFFSKPIYLIVRKRNQVPNPNTYQQASENSDSTGTDSVSSTTRKAAAEEEEHDMSELWVHQLIHTIEFVLGSVSNTASYLRLWALSLAHAELSDVLWNMTIANQVGNVFMLFVFFFLWFVASVLVLVVLEGLSAFLHALRLHWVEFNNKFYIGGGYKFEPFSLVDDASFLD